MVTVDGHNRSLAPWGKIRPRADIETMNLRNIPLRLGLVVALTTSYIGSTLSQVVILKVGDTGSHAELAARRNPEGLVLLHNPGISALLARADSLKGSALTASEKKRIADSAPVIATPKSVAEATIRQRGYE